VRTVNAFLDMLSADFMQRAFVAGALIAVCCSTLGVFLVLRRYAMLGEGLAHSSIAAVGLALLLGITPLIVAVPLAAASSLFIMRLSRKTTVYGEMAVGMVSAASLALGVLLSSLGGGFSQDLYSYLVGSILAITPLEVVMTAVLSAAVLGLTVVFHVDLFVIAYDEDFARVSGRKTRALSDLLAVLSGITVVLGVRVVGAVLITGLIVFPAVTSLQFARSFKSSLVFSALLSLVSVVAGITLSYFLSLPSGATIVLVNAAVFGGALVLTRLRRPRGKKATTDGHG
jgi:ABC-type Mn2+/Zn2+ transport system permease subunit